jgi:hypothetical protein
MIEVPKKRDPFRFRLYYKLMDACLLLAVPAFITFIFYPNGPPEGASSAFISLFFALFNVVSFGSLFLLLAGFMRDEYAEGLYRRSLVIMSRLGSIVPPIVLIGAWIAYYISLRLLDPAAPLDGSVILDAPEYIDWLFKPEIIPLSVIMNIWGLFLLSYVVVFQFLRWRDR